MIIITMEDSKFKKIIIILVTALFLLSVFSIGFSAFLYKKITAGNNQGTGQQGQILNNNQSLQPLISQSSQATGFLGFPISKLAKEGDLLKFTMKGHWLLDKDTKFDYINKNDNIQAEIRINTSTVIKTIEFQPSKSGGVQKEETISVNEFNIDSFSSPYLIVFADSAGSLAKEIKVYPKIP